MSGIRPDIEVGLPFSLRLPPVAAGSFQVRPNRISGPTLIIIKHIFLGKEEPDRIIQRRTEYLHAPPTFYESGLL